MFALIHNINFAPTFNIWLKKIIINQMSRPTIFINTRITILDNTSENMGLSCKYPSLLYIWIRVEKIFLPRGLWQPLSNFNYLYYFGISRFIAWSDHIWRKGLHVGILKKYTYLYVIIFKFYLTYFMISYSIFFSHFL